MRLIPVIFVLICVSIVIPAHAEWTSCDDVFPNIRYYITDGVEKLCNVDEATKSIIIEFMAKSDGQIVVKIPRASELDPCNRAELIILRDAEETSFEEKKSFLSRTLTIPFKEGNTQIEIVTTYFPEYPHVEKPSDCTAEKSPRQQAISGVSLDEIVCNRDFVLIEKETDHSAACVIPSTAKSLVDRGWGQYVFYSGSFNILEQNIMYAVDYKIRNGIVNDIVADHNAESLIVDITQTRDGEIIIKIPRAVIDARLGPYEGGTDDVFFVLVDGKEVKFTEKKRGIIQGIDNTTHYKFQAN